MPRPKANDSRCVLGIGNIIGRIEINGSVYGVGDSVTLFRDGDVIGFVLFALVGEVLPEEIEAGIVAKSKTRFVGIAVGQEGKDIAVQFVIFAVFSIGPFVPRLR